MFRKLLPAIAALGFVGAIAIAADPPAKDAAKTVKTPDPSRKIIKWPGGWMYVDEPGVIYHDNSAPKGPSMNLIENSGNGIGNSIIIDGSAPGTTVIKNSRNGIGNTLRVTPEGPVIDLSAKPAVKLDMNRYKGKDAKFWSKKVHSDALRCDLFWCPKAELWFKYDKFADLYLPVTAKDLK